MNSRNVEKLNPITALLASLAIAPLHVAYCDTTDANPSANAAGDVVSLDGTAFARSDAKGEKDATTRNLKPGDSIYPQDVVNTGSNGHIKILMRDKSIVDLGPSSLFKVDHFDNKSGGTDREVEVSLPYGTMRAAIAQKLTGKGKFKVRTPSATMGVRGTEFIVKAEITNMEQLGKMINHPGEVPPGAIGRNPASDSGTTSVTVLQGQVDMSHHDFDASAVAGRTPSAAGGSPSPGVISLTAGTQLSSNQASGIAENKPVQVDSQQISTLTSTAKMTDTTFQKAVTVEPSAGSGGQNGANTANGAPSALPAPLAQAISIAAASTPPPPVMTATGLGVPGSFSNIQAFITPSVNTRPITHNVNIVIVSGQ
ncbi:MAG: FecR family protein [Oligoflexia bacterium]|nr:FecR family protein [Oligoflexia bacterium]